jgi:DNA-binding transcriptional LysR family regulator
MTQPPLSQQIRQLENELEVKLFRKAGRGVELTDAGSAFLAEARQTLAQAENAARVARRAARGEIGRLDVGLVVTAAYSVVPSTLRAFRERYPHVRVALHELTSPDQTRALSEQRIDVGFLRLPVFGRGLEIMTILREPLVVALPEDHPLATSERIPVPALAGESFVMSSPRLRLAWHDQITRLCEEAGFVPEVTQQAVNVETILGLISVGIGVTLLPASVAEWQRKGVAYRPLVSDELVDMVVAWRKEERKEVVKAFVGVVSEIFGAKGRHGRSAERT